ncbi:hypothetical protein [Jannaschia seohaensis]|uniref:Uncharacterized protein n=1 Tax=Jannaschia seohaensis TaxID=475081 RepID=A0A2Y9ANJ0_9RHOB|nr:hypothetical protein [Jannaschia seohaensis]PWJ19082.1 hypothetical protein BCF38_10410 [Jannaschia seohaensis]SSA45695.1 hypothetical protein SAMN05421539_10410 [Jannaschia seohaensis]
MSDSGNSAPCFLADESGAITVDWVVLTAALVGLGLAVMAVVSGGAEDLSGDVRTQLESDGIIRVSFSNGGGAFEAAAASLGIDVSEELGQMRTMSNSQILAELESSTNALATASADAESLAAAFAAFEADTGWQTIEMVGDGNGEPVPHTVNHSFTHNGQTYTNTAQVEEASIMLANTIVYEEGRVDAYTNEAAERGI